MGNSSIADWMRLVHRQMESVGVEFVDREGISRFLVNDHEYRAAKKKWLAEQIIHRDIVALLNKAIRRARHKHEKAKGHAR